MTGFSLFFPCVALVAQPVGTIQTTRTPEREACKRCISNIPCSYPRWGAAFPGNACPNVHDWGQVCMFQGKNGQDFRAFTTTIYTTLKRWADEGVAGLEDKSRARKAPRKATLPVRNEIRKLQENPLLGKWRMHTALLREGISVSPATCARIMAVNHFIPWADSVQVCERKRMHPFRKERPGFGFVSASREM